MVGAGGVNIEHKNMAVADVEFVVNDLSSAAPVRNLDHKSRWKQCRKKTRPGLKAFLYAKLE
jgi:hypothetical protein